MTEKTPDKTPKKPLCLFHDVWLEDPKFKDWLTKTDNLTGERSQAERKVCRKNIKLGTMGVGAIRSHMTRSTVHKERMKLFRQALSDEAEAAGHLNDEVLVENTNSLTTTNIQSPDNNDKQCGLIDDNVRTAELLYALNMVYNCASLNEQSTYVAQRHVILYTEWLGKKPKSRPTSASYECVSLAVKDGFVLAKMKFFGYVASIVEPFFQWCR